MQTDLTSLAGRFIVLDGPDGSGKSTEVALLADYLRAKGLDVVCTSDPGGTKIGDQISRLLKYDAQGAMSVNTEVMLFMASRAQLVSEVIRPALAEGKVVLSDRFISSTCAYQGAAGYPLERIIQLGGMATGDLWPDLTIILDLPVDIGLQRAGRRRFQRTKDQHDDCGQGLLFSNPVADRFDSRPLDYHRKVRREFLRLAEYYPRPVRIVDTMGLDPQQVHQRVVEQIWGWLVEGSGDK